MYRISFVSANTPVSERTVMQRYRLLCLISSVTIILDQVTKLYIDSSFRLYGSIAIFEEFFHITYIRNPGAAFSILANTDASFRVPFFLTLSLIAVTGIILFYRTVEDRLVRVALSLIFGGAVGNMIDRVRFGEVIDFIDVHWYHNHWPAFNIADSAITIGVGFLLLDAIFKERKRRDE